jgi:hypothetical protein
VVSHGCPIYLRASTEGLTAPGELRLFPSNAVDQTPAVELPMEVTCLLTNDLTFWVEGVKLGPAYVQLTSSCEGKDQVLDQVKVTVTPFVADEDADGLCRHCESCIACGSKHGSEPLTGCRREK